MKGTRTLMMSHVQRESRDVDNFCNTPCLLALHNVQNTTLLLVPFKLSCVPVVSYWCLFASCCPPFFFSFIFPFPSFVLFRAVNVSKVRVLLFLFAYPPPFALLDGQVVPQAAEDRLRHIPLLRAL